MANVSYTGPQRYAVFGDTGNLLVSAAAGSGKTFTLSAHIVELIRSGRADIDGMLVVTFTRASAADMKRKIGESLSRAAAEAKSTDPTEYARLSRSAKKVRSADISTMHSFLYKILRRYFSELGIAQDSRLVSNSAVIGKMKADVMREVTNTLFEEGDAEFLRLADILSTVRETDKLEEELFGIAERLSSNGLDPSALSEYADMLGDSTDPAKSLLFSPLGEPVRYVCDKTVTHFLTVFGELREEFVSYPDVAEKYGDECRGLIEWLESADGALSAGDLPRLCELFAGYARPRLRPIGRAKCELSEEFAYRREEMKKAVTSLALKLGKFPTDEIALAGEETARVLKSLEKVLRMYFDGYEKKKRDSSVLDYSDLESLALRLLTDENGKPTPSALSIGKKYKYVFIDEYQDTNKTQDAVFRALSENARRFMVGDIKQAIYGFRGADPSVFSEYRRKWETVDPETDTGFVFSPDGGRVLLMSDNFRSAEPVTNLVNAVSDCILPFGGIPYSEGDGLICSRSGGRDDCHKDAEVILIQKKSTKKDGDDESDESDGLDPEIEYVADRIASTVGKQYGDKIVRPGDIAILLRKNEYLTRYGDALTRRGIPVYIDREKPLSDSPAVMLMMCLLNFVDNPLRDVYAAGALRSPVFGFDLNELITVRGYAEGLPLFVGVRNCAGDSEREDGLREKCGTVLDWIEREKTVSRGMSPEKYISYLADALSVFSLDGIRENGLERDALNKLFRMAGEFEANVSSPVGRVDLSAFLDYAAEVLGESGKNEDGQAQSPDAVSIMSIHKSKGLEFPICYVSGCGLSFVSSKDASRTLVFDKDLGIGMFLPDNSGLSRCDTFFRVSVCEKIRRASVEEEMRVLYVALSRACDKLIVTAKVPSIDTLMKRAEYAAKCTDGYSVLSSTHYIDWIMEALTRKKVPRTVVKMYSDGAFVSPDGGEGSACAADECGEKTPDIDISELEKRAEFNYPLGYLGKIPSKLTVSRLSPTVLDTDDGDGEYPDITRALDGINQGKDGDEKTPELTLKKPAFMTGEKWASASERGSATHVFMQFADFGRLRESGAQAEIDRLVREKYISPESSQLVSLKQIERFSHSTLMDKLVRSEFVKREFRFNVRMNAGDFTGDDDLRAELDENGVRVTVQGVVDCVFRDPDSGELTLIDYKTDSFSEEEWKNRALCEEKLRFRHTNQLTYYRNITSEMFREPVTHAYVYSTVLGELVEV